MTKGISITPDRLGEREFGEGHVWCKKPLTWNVNCAFPLTRPMSAAEIFVDMGDHDEHRYEIYRPR